MLQKAETKAKKMLAKFEKKCKDYKVSEIHIPVRKFQALCCFPGALRTLKLFGEIFSRTDCAFDLGVCRFTFRDAEMA